MKNFVVTIEEMISQDFNVLAEDFEQAERIAMEKYAKGEFALAPGNLVAKQIEIHDVTDDVYTEWIEF